MTVELNPRYTFDAFVVGASNRLAMTAARAVAENPGNAHNPLFIYSQTGLGKTHLVMAIGHRVLELTSTARIEYLTLDTFVEAYHAAVSLGQVEAFRRRYSDASLLLLDDVQFLANRQETQSELLRFAAELKEAGTQLVLTSDRSPSEIANLDQRLITQLDSGLVVDIGTPDYETRLAILRRRAEDRGVALAEGVLEVVGAYDVQNVRELIGILNRLIAFQAVSEKPLTPHAARVLLEGGTAADVEPAVAKTAVAGAAAPDEFGQFLTGVTAVVEQQVEVWKDHLREVIQRWNGLGYRTGRLESLLAERDPPEIEAAIAEFEGRIDRLRELEAEIVQFDPALATNPAFHDPDRAAEAAALVQKTKETFVPPPGPSESFALDAFIVGEATKVAHGAVRAVIDEPGAHYNPLVMVGPAGVGKTHLLHATGRALADKLEGRWVACTSAQVFLDELVRAIEGDHIAVWRARYRQASALLLDNVDLLAGRDRVQEELFYLFNVLAESGRQLMFTASGPPRDIEGLDERLRSRLEGGLVATLDPPGPDIRQAVVTNQLREKTGRADDDLVTYLAEQPAESVRAVLGMVHRVLTAAEAQDAGPSVEMAREVLGASAAREARAAHHPVTRLVPTPAGIASAEKMVWRWPDPMEYVIEELA